MTTDKPTVEEIRERAADGYRNVPASETQCSGCSCSQFAATRADIDFLLAEIDHLKASYSK